MDNFKIMKFLRLISGMIIIVFLAGCARIDTEFAEDTGRDPLTEPDYSGVTVPYNIAPLNFRIKEAEGNFVIEAIVVHGDKMTVKSSNGIVNFPQKAWRQLLEDNKGGEIEIRIFSGDSKKSFKYNPFKIFISNEPADPYIAYRLLYPGYETYMELKIVQRNIESFRESSVIENQLVDKNCINCHSFNKNNPAKFMVHIRGSVGGTYFVNGEKITKTNLKTKEMDNGAVYPSWHPDGKFLTFSSNEIIQSFHSVPDKIIEVHDLASSLLLYDVEKNEIMPVHDYDTARYMDTFSEWSPDGKYLYFCRARQVDRDADFRNIKYNLARKSFNEAARTFGSAEIMFDAEAIGKSVSFPRISPDGHYLVFTLHEYGTFSIWHKEADLHLMDLQTGKTVKMNINSDESESYHSWSSNGKWLVFSSKRGDGLTARPYFAYFGSADSIGKPFVLPQKDPDLYKRMVHTFNKPEFVTGKIIPGPRKFGRAAKTKAVDATWADFPQEK